MALNFKETFSQKNCQNFQIDNVDDLIPNGLNSFLSDLKVYKNMAATNKPSSDLNKKTTFPEI
jgi:hypothetical protein